jgi:hypothetical protein
MSFIPMAGCLPTAAQFPLIRPFLTAKRRGLLTELGIDPPALQKKCVDRDLYQRLSRAYFFDKETFGVDFLRLGAFSAEASDFRQSA